ncbi:MAG TPA: hypothetical protein PLV92_05725 [Pirellulaceae bacterium]|nr:hypothetical protein [Pirellulaceae bacterium]
MKPLISLQFREAKRQYWPGDELECLYQIDAVESSEITSVEASVLWYTEGKGESDMAVHCFQRRLPGDVAGGDLRMLDRLRTRLPNSPLSYIGVILKLHWCVRVRVFYGKNGHATAELPFQLGQVPEAKLNERPQSESASAGDAASPTGDDDEQRSAAAETPAAPRRPRVIDVDDPAEQEKRALRAQRREARRLRREAAGQEQATGQEHAAGQETVATDRAGGNESAAAAADLTRTEPSSTESVAPESVPTAPSEAAPSESARSEAAQSGSAPSESAPGGADKSGAEPAPDTATADRPASDS